MLFHTPTFGLFFLVFLLFYLPVRRSHWGMRVIVVFSSVFYGCWDWRFLPLLWVTILVDFTIGLLLARSREAHTRKLLLVASVAVNLSILGYFKYWNFLVASFLGNRDAGRMLALPQLVLPLGISFYVFQSMSYIIDVYRGIQAPIRSLFEFAAFVTFFPHLIAGPIQRIQQLVPQIVRPDDITLARIASGAFIFSTGLLRKALGDLLAAYHDPIFGNVAQEHPAVVVVAILTFGLQIYLDFSGYSEMAIGIARVIGIDLVQNFASPYLSASISEFWRRWHISLSNWLRDYLYISLGGSRAGHLRQVRNLLLTMTLCGLWHGAGWNYVIWGFIHGVYLSMDVLFVRLFGVPAPARGPLRAAKTISKVLLTYIAANYAWLYFRLPTLHLCLAANQKIWAWLTQPAWPNLPPGVYAVAAVVLIMDVANRYTGALFPVAGFTMARGLSYGIIAGLCFAAAVVLSIGHPTRQFIYFQF